MKTIIRRASHGSFNYRTTDRDGMVILWENKPTAYDGRERWEAKGKHLWTTYAAPCSSWKLSIRKIVDAK